jgi:membrane-associated phospholipid phosphatase
LYRTLQRRAGVAVAAAIALLASMAVTSAPASAHFHTSQPTTATVYYWNDVLLEAFRVEGGGPGPLSRAAAMMHAGIYNTYNMHDWWVRDWLGSGYGFYGALPNPSPSYGGFDWAAGKVASELLIDNFPDQSAAIEQAFTSRHGTTAPTHAQAVVDEVLANIRTLRDDDGADDDTPYQFGSDVGAWQLTGGLCDAPVTPNWGRVKPFGGSAVTSFVQQHPGGHSNYADLLASQLYADHLNEVKELGRYDSTTRTAEQETIAWFWAVDLDGTYKPPGQLLDHARIAAQQEGVTDALELARVFLHTSLALADAGIAAWYQKYETTVDLWRPETAIREAANDGNSNTSPDPDWLPLSADHPPSQDRFSPCFPAWVSGHATFAAAWAGIMRNTFGDNVTITLDSEDPRAQNVQRTFSSYTQAAEENARSRVYLGVHYQFDADDGLATGFAVADHIFASVAGPLTCIGPPGSACW